MKERKNMRTHWLSIRLSDPELVRLKTLHQQSKCRGLSEYARKVLLKEPVVIIYFNESAAEILTVLLGVKKELSALGNNFNQVVKKLHTLNEIPEVKIWAILYEKQVHSLIHKTQEISQQMHQIYEQWSQK